MSNYYEQYRSESNRMPGWDYSRNGYYFVTPVLQGMKWILGKITDGKMILSDFGKIVNEEWLKSFEIRQELILDEFIIMPNHLHAIIILKHAEDAHNHSSEIDNFINDPYLSNTDDFDENEYFNDDQNEIWHRNENSNEIGNGNEKSDGNGNEKSHGNGNGNVQTHGRASLRAGQSAQSHFYRPSQSISSFMAGFKSATTSKIDDYIDLHQLPIPKYNRNNRLWQLNYNDHIIRNDREYTRIKSYIQNNPKKWEKDKFKS